MRVAPSLRLRGRCCRAPAKDCRQEDPLCQWTAAGSVGPATRCVQASLRVGRSTPQRTKRSSRRVVEHCARARENSLTGPTVRELLPCLRRARRPAPAKETAGGGLPPPQNAQHNRSSPTHPPSRTDPFRLRQAVHACVRTAVWNPLRQARRGSLYWIMAWWPTSSISSTRAPVDQPALDLRPPRLPAHVHHRRDPLGTATPHRAGHRRPLQHQHHDGIQRRLPERDHQMLRIARSLR